MEGTTAERQSERASDRAGISPDKIQSGLALLIQGQDWWLKAIAIDVAGDLELQELVPHIRGQIESSEPVIREIALRSLERMPH